MDGYYLNAQETVILEVATSLCLFFMKKKKANGWRVGGWEGPGLAV